MLITAGRPSFVHAVRPLARFAPPPSFSTSTLAFSRNKDRQGTDRDARQRHTAPPPRPSNPPARRTPVHAPRPQPKGLTEHKHLFDVRTRWLARAVAEGQHVPKDLLYRFLDVRRIPPAHIALWIRVLGRRDPIYALQELGLLESAQAGVEDVVGSSSSSATPPCPDWLYLSLPGMVTDPSHVPYLASQLLSPRFAQLDEQNRGLFVARCLQHFLKVRHYVALRETVEWVAYTRPSSASSSTPGRRGLFGNSQDASPPSAGLSSSRSFGRLLSALASERLPASHASATPSSVLAPLVHLLTSTMTARSVPRSPETWRPLFSPKLVPRHDPAAAISLLQAMKASGAEPLAPELHAVMGVCARAGKTEAVKVLRTAIRGAQRYGRASINSHHLRKLAELGGERVRAFDKIGGGGWARAVKAQEEGEVEVVLAEELDDAAREEKEEELQETEREERRAGKVKGEGTAFAQALVEDVRDDPDLVKQTASTAIGREKRAKKQSESPTPPLPPASSSPKSPVSIYDTTTLLNPFVSLTYLSILRESLVRSGRHTDFPPPPFPFDSVSWTTFFYTICRHPSVETSTILDLLRWIEDVSTRKRRSSPPVYVPSAPTLPLYGVVLRALVSRREYKPALHLWRSLEARGWRPDGPMLDALVRVFCGINRDGLARRLLLFHGHRRGIDPPELLLSPRVRNPDPRGGAGKYPHSVKLDAVPLNSLLSHLNRSGQYDAAFELFKRFEGEFGVRPDAATLSIMLDAARFASAAAGKGSGLGVEDLSSLSLGGVTSSSPSFDGELRPALDDPAPRGKYGLVVDDRWDGVPAARRMERFLWVDVLEANWQDAAVEDPLYPRSSARGGEAAGGRKGLTGWIAEHFGGPEPATTPLTANEVDSWPSSSPPADSPSAVLPPPDWRPFVSTLSPSPPLYPHLHPTDRTFRSLIQLTGYHSHPRSIPLLLAWMRHLGVVPSRWTLALAILYVENDAGIQSWRVERWKRGLEEWVGRRNVPSEKEVAWIRRGGRTEGVPEVRD
ncbi:hypothetical protein JCM8097_000324 [Rhodosporidiobolus ruineniae]